VQKGGEGKISLLLTDSRKRNNPKGGNDEGGEMGSSSEERTANIYEIKTVGFDRGE